MQELRSTDILDKEIQTDARKRAEKILKKADSDVSNILASVDENVEKAKTDKVAFFQQKLDAFEKDQQASIPLEKERFEVSFIQGQLSEKINKYLESIPEEKRMDLVCKFFTFKLEKNVNAYVYGFDLAKGKDYLSKKLGSKMLSCEKTDFGRILVEDDCGLNKQEGFILEAEDKSFRCRLTISQVVSSILDEDRKELYEALFENN